MMGESVMGYIKRLKQQKAAHQLVYSKELITDLAFDSGYESVEAFIRSFKKFFGYSPLQYRKLANSKNALPQISTIKVKEYKMEVKVVKLPKINVAYVRHTGPYKECKSAWETLCAWAGPKGLIGPETSFVGVCHDDPDMTEPSKIRFDACITLNEETKPAGKIGIKEIESDLYAMTTHIGPYENLNETYAILCGKWAPQNGKEVKSKASIEIYKNDPNTTPREKLITEVYVAIES